MANRMVLDKPHMELAIIVYGSDTTNCSLWNSNAPEEYQGIDVITVHFHTAVLLGNIHLLVFVAAAELARESLAIDGQSLQPHARLLPVLAERWYRSITKVSNKIPRFQSNRLVKRALAHLKNVSTTSI
jgi:hypothetical protein